MKNEKAEKEAPNCRHQIHEERLGSYYTEVVLSFLQANHSLNHLLQCKEIRTELYFLTEKFYLTYLNVWFTSLVITADLE